VKALGKRAEGKKREALGCSRAGDLAATTPNLIITWSAQRSLAHHVGKFAHPDTGLD
jgi:hypothetical protein